MDCAFFTSVLAVPILSWSSSIWDLLEIIGPSIVLYGVGRELWLLMQKLPKDAPDLAALEAEKHKKEVRAALVVVVGVALELVVVPHSLVEV